MTPQPSPEDQTPPFELSPEMHRQLSLPVQELMLPAWCPQPCESWSR